MKKRIKKQIPYGQPDTTTLVRKDISFPRKEKKGEVKSRDGILKHNLDEYVKKSQLDLFQTNTQLQVDVLMAELENHKKAIKFLLSTNKQFQNEIQKKELKKEAI